MKKITVTLVLALAVGCHRPQDDLGPDRACVSVRDGYYCVARGRAYLCDYDSCAELPPGVTGPALIQVR